MFKCVDEFEFAAQLFYCDNVKDPPPPVALRCTAVHSIAAAAKIESLGPTIWSILILHYLLQQAGLQVHNLTDRKIRLEFGKIFFRISDVGWCDNACQAWLCTRQGLHCIEKKSNNNEKQISRDPWLPNLKHTSRKSFLRHLGWQLDPEVNKVIALQFLAFQFAKMLVISYKTLKQC